MTKKRELRVTLEESPHKKNPRDLVVQVNIELKDASTGNTKSCSFELFRSTDSMFCFYSNAMRLHFLNDPENLIHFPEDWFEWGNVLSWMYRTVL